MKYLLILHLFGLVGFEYNLDKFN